MTATHVDLPSTEAERSVLFAELAEWASNHPSLGASQSFLRQMRTDFINPATVRSLLTLRERTVERQVAEITVVEPTVEQFVAVPLPIEPVVESTPAPAPLITGMIEKLWPGIYTIETEHGHRTFQVHVQPSDDEFAPGESILSYLCGPNNTDDYIACAFIKPERVIPFRKFRSNDSLMADIAQLVADPDEALKAKHCRRCNRVLTTPESVSAGYGPECVKKGDR